METPNPFWLNLSVAVFFFGGFFAIAFYLHERQRRILNEVAEKYQFNFIEGGSGRIIFPSEKAIPRGGWIIRCTPEARWKLSGELEGIDVCLYKMYLRTGSVSTPSHRVWGYPYLVGRFVCDEVDLPRTLLRPRPLLLKIGRAILRVNDSSPGNHILYSDYTIDTDSEREFSHVFGLQAIRVLQAMEGFTFEGLSNAFYLFKKPSPWRFLSLNSSDLGELILGGVKLAKELK